MPFRNGPTQNATASTLKCVGGVQAMRASTETSARQNQQRSIHSRAIQQRVLPTTTRYTRTRNLTHAAGDNATRTTPTEATASNVRASPAMTRSNRSTARAASVAASEAPARVPLASTANHNSVACSTSKLTAPQ
ncbi:unnamed protein product [Albugo candida]|uniref:Uncharacterized protein n=1 Tax=Albugo candida TaxID=65357 RepID=A0A024FV52_9STRA|nr:unnamed protein product [Albugo candida]|eukprot:CCI10519.1 unnamed protein product [Albugo candida]